MTELEVLSMLAKASGGSHILLDGHELRSLRIRAATQLAVAKGWLNLGPLIEVEQYGFYRAQITEQGREALATLLHEHTSREAEGVTSCDD